MNLPTKHVRPGMRHALYTIAIAVSCAVLFGSCSEDQKPITVDESAPSVRIAYPPTQIDRNVTVSDSTDVYLVARDDRGIDYVELFFRRPDEAEPRSVAVVRAPISASEVPDSLDAFVQVPEGSSLYRTRWRTQAISSGSRPNLFARAKDTSGNVGVSDQVTVFILNGNGDIGPPAVGFKITPSDPKEKAPVEFDALPGDATRDSIDSPDKILLKWDFEGNANIDDPEDPNWNTDWVRADIKQIYTYEREGTYNVQVLGKNTYYEFPGKHRRQIRVKSEVGDPTPPDPDNYAELPAREFTIGTVDTNLAHSGIADADEYPSFRNRLNSRIAIEKTEVTNQLYLGYIQATLGAETEFRAGGIFVIKDRTLPNDSTVLGLSLENSRIFFNLDDREFQVQEGFADHPVTGVTYFGAEAYARHYGMRLPTEAEWECAARGDSSAWIFAWGRSLYDGDATGKARSNYSRSSDPFEPTTTPVKFYDGRLFNGFQTVDTPGYPFPDGVNNGVYDLAGNVAEWVLDWYGPYPANRQQDYSGPISGEFKVIRGGSYQSSGERGVRCTDRSAGAPLDASYPSVGFRCAFAVIQGR